MDATSTPYFRHVTEPPRSYTLSLHDALPILSVSRRCHVVAPGRRANETMRPTSENSSHQPPWPSESNQSDANNVTAAASSERHRMSHFVNIQTFSGLVHSLVGSAPLAL